MEMKFFGSIDEFEIIKKIWNHLIIEGGTYSFFQSWEWNDCWIKSLAKEQVEVCMAVAFEAEIPVCAFFFGRNNHIRNYIIPVSSLSINTTNNTYFDDIFIEYNTFLIRQGYQLNYQEIFDTLDKSFHWNEIHIQAATHETARQLGANLQTLNHLEIIQEYTSPAFSVDLKSIREQGISYLDCVSKNKKKQIKSSLNAYNRLGELSIRQASSEQEAILFYDSLVDLHEKRWSNKGETGAFSNEFLLGFHKRMIKTNIDLGCIQLLEISCGNKPIGYLYNFVYQNKVYFYQSGFVYESENKFRPGLVSHYFAITLNLEKGYGVYDFLVGNDAYKKSLSTTSTNLHWFRIQKNIWRFQFENYLKKMFRTIVKRKDS